MSGFTSGSSDVESEVSPATAKDEAESGKAAEAKVEAAPAQEDLEVISGIGPKIVHALNAAGVVTFSDLIARTPEELEQIVRTAQVRMVGHASNWIAQAKFLQKGDVDGWKRYLEELRSEGSHS
jgi:predicted flap endonuclease-1-like 5' DNA nuclease